MNHGASYARFEALHSQGTQSGKYYAEFCDMHIIAFIFVYFQEFVPLAFVTRLKVVWERWTNTLNKIQGARFYQGYVTITI